MDKLSRVKNVLRPLKNTFLLLLGAAYDAWRFLCYSGIYHKLDRAKFSYKLIKAYHRIEKSLSFSNRKKNGGMTAALDFLKLVERRRRIYSTDDYTECVGVGALKCYYDAIADKDNHDSERIRQFLDNEQASMNSSLSGGVFEADSSLLSSGKLMNPELFFMTRYSVRNFEEKPVDSELIVRALELASKTPSVCNRQSWFTYHIDDKEIIKQALSLQNGNSGFTDNIPCLFIVTADLKAFDTSIERYQHWIDGGMYAMSLILAFHSLGVASCCLNWSQGPSNDIKLRKMLGIEKKHSIIMMVAVGYPAEKLKLCFSTRNQQSLHYKKITNV